MVSQEEAEMFEGLRRVSKVSLARAISDYEGIDVEEAIIKIDERNK